MPSINVSELEPYSRWVVPLILAKYPEWEEFGRLVPGAEHGRAVMFEIPCPSRNVDDGLWISTEHDELTVGFHTHHAHFSDYDIPKSEDHVRWALEEASAYLEDKLGVVSWYDGQRPIGTTTCELPAHGPLPRVFHLHPVSHGTLRSWSGLQDRDERNR